MTPAWSRSRNGGWHWRLDQGRVLEVIPKSTGWCIRFMERSDSVKMSWPWEYSYEAKARAESMAVELGWLSEVPRR